MLFTLNRGSSHDNHARNQRRFVTAISEPLEPRVLFAADPALINQPPSFTLMGNVNAPENAPTQVHPNWATNISPGPATEAAQTVTFIVTNNNPSLFSVQPAISSDGTLTFTPTLQVNGEALVTISAQDNGGVANGGIDTSRPQAFTIKIQFSNDAPTFTKGPDQVVNENAPAQTVRRWARNIAIPKNDEPNAQVIFILLNDNNALFSAQPAIASDGTLAYTPAPNASGVAHVTVWAQEFVPDDPADRDTSVPQAFTITINFVNQPPTFNIGSTQVIASGADPQTIPNFVTNITPGPATESSQTVTFLVTNDNPTLFTVQPALTPDGTLTYTPTPGAQGIATITITATDNSTGNNTATQIAVIGIGVQTLADAYENNDTRAIVDSRTEGALNSPNRGVLSKKLVGKNLNTLDDSSDWYRFRIGATATKAHWAMINFNNAQGALTMTLVPAKGKIWSFARRRYVKSMAADARTNRQAVSFAGLRAGIYYLQVQGAQNPNYSLTINPPAIRTVRALRQVAAPTPSTPTALFSQSPINSPLQTTPLTANPLRDQLPPLSSVPIY